jgi:CRISPR-associated protein Cas2
MAANQVRLFLLAYDIADPRRLVRVHRTVRNQGIPLQYSVFLVPGTAADIDGLLAELDCIIDPREDDIRVYPLPKVLDVVQYGRQWLPYGISTDPADPVDGAIMLLTGTPNPVAEDPLAPQAKS